MIKLEELSEKVERRGPVRDGEFALPVDGHIAKKLCACGCNEECEVPVKYLDEKGDVREEYSQRVGLPKKMFGFNYAPSELIYVIGREIMNGTFLYDREAYKRLGHWVKKCDD